MGHYIFTMFVIPYRVFKKQTRTIVLYSIRLINNKSSVRIIRDATGQMYPVAHSTAFIYFYYFYLRNKNLWFPRPPSERFSECVIDSRAENSICVELCTLLMVPRCMSKKVPFNVLVGLYFCDLNSYYWQRQVDLGLG